jgi:hypothetical protein
MKSELIARRNDSQNARSYYLVSYIRRIISFNRYSKSNEYDSMKFVVEAAALMMGDRVGPQNMQYF